MHRKSPTLSHPFTAELAPALAAGIDASALEPALWGLVARARAEFPRIDIDPATFVAHVAARIPDDWSVEQALGELYVGDLYLACACCQGDPAALRVFEQQFLSMVAAWIKGVDALSSFTDEVRQEIRNRLLAPREGLAPRIASYSGQGPLGSWVRMAAVRMAIDLRRSKRREVALENAPPLRSPGADPELRYLKERYGREFRRAFTTTLAALTTREANVLRLYYLEGMSPDAIGATYGVHPRTVHKWLTVSRRNILAQTRRLLGERLGLKETELDSLMVLVKSELDLSIARFLKQKRRR
jgi:RNA polymerase sigma-70 factor (ECF subfamily)